MASFGAWSLSIERPGSLRVLTVIGARPQFVKAAAVSRAIASDAVAADGGIRQVVVHTGQHYDPQMSDVFFSELQIGAPDYQLDVGSGSHGAQTGAMMARIEETVVEVQPDLVLVYGDTNSTLAGALVAVKMHVSVAHVEAGLRSFDRSMPEEINRVVTDHVSSVLFCPSDHSVKQLEAEGVRDGVVMVGDVMLDIFRSVYKRLPERNLCAGAEGIEDGYIVVTLHRPANVDDPIALERICGALNAIARRGETILWPVHPRTRRGLSAHRLHAGVHLIEPVGYVEMLMLLRGCSVVMTDSGGLQKEALWSSKPCVTMRTTTEWVETVEVGWNVLVGSDADRLVDAALNFRPSGTPPAIYGNGDASAKIVDRLLQMSGSKVRL